MSTGSPLIDHDWQLRLAAFAQLGLLAQRTGGVVTREELDQGFEFEGERIKYSCFVTAPQRAGRQPRYDDQVGSSSGEFVLRVPRATIQSFGPTWRCGGRIC